MFRFGNPYTSNLNLTNVNDWLTINGGDADGYPFYVLKGGDAFAQSWTMEDGSTVAPGTANVYVRAKRSEDGIWTGSSEALLIRPLEMFRVTVTTLNTITNVTDLVNVNVNFSNTIKTFANSLTALTPESGNKTADNFYQLEVGIYNPNSELIGSPIYLGTSNQLKTANDFHENENNIIYFVEEDLDGTPVANTKTLINTFKDDYVKMPIQFKFYGVKIGEEYLLKFKLKENSIFTEAVEKFEGDAKFFLYDNVEQKAYEITSDFELPVTIASGLNSRYDFYWKDYPKGDLGNNDLSSKFKTTVYKANENDFRVKFDSSKVASGVEIFTINGQKITSQTVKTIQQDLKLNLPVGEVGVYVIKTTYNDGTTVSQKLLVD